MTVKYRRLRIVKHRKGQIHDEDVARWRLEVPEQAAVALAQQVGYGQAVLPPTAHPPLLSPQPAHNALDYANLLPPDVRHAVFRHCEMMARHQRLLLEGQERLKYVQAQIREMKARLPPPPPRPVAGMNRTAKGPDVPPHQVRSPSCWASCCGLAPLPPPPLPSTEAGGPGVGPGGGGGGGGGPLAPVALELPPPDYFAQAALATALAQSRRQTLEAQAEQEDYQHALSAGGASLASSGGGVRPFTSSGGGGAVLTTAATGPGRRRDTTGQDPSDNLVAAGDLPGQMDRRRGSSAGGGGGGPAVADGVAGGPLGGGRPAMAPLQGRAPGTPQSLLRPLASYGAPGAAAAPGAGAGAGAGGSAPRKVLLPAMRASQAGAAAAAAAGGPGGGGTAAAVPAAPAASSYDLSRYQDPESLRKITAIQAAQRGRVARKQVAEMRAPTAAAAPQSRAAPPPASSYDLSRYQDPATLKKITTIQAAQRGRAARKQLAGMRSQQQPVAGPGPGPSAHPFDLPPLSQSRAMAPLPPGLPGRARLAAPPVDVTPQPLKEEQEAAARLAAAQAAAVADDEMALLEASLAAGVVEVAAPGPGRGPSPAAATAGAPRQQAPRDHDLSRYQDPESIRKITAIQAAQRGRVARKQVAGMRSAAPPPPPPPAAAAPQPRAAPPPASSYDLSRYQDPATLKKITTIQAAQRGRVARKQVAGMKGAK